MSIFYSDGFFVLNKFVLLFALLQKVKQKNQDKPKCSAVLRPTHNSYSALVVGSILFLALTLLHVTIFLEYN